jgi:hypothetical protein
MDEQVFFGIAMEMDLPDLLNFCLLSKKTISGEGNFKDIFQ